MKGAVEEEGGLAQSIIKEMNGFAADSSERVLLWKARHEMSSAYRHIQGMASLGGDICESISKLPELVAYARELIAASDLTEGIFGNVGDSNFHTISMYDAANAADSQKVQNINGQLTLRAIDLGGISQENTV